MLVLTPFVGVVFGVHIGAADSKYRMWLRSAVVSADAVSVALLVP